MLVAQGHSLRKGRFSESWRAYLVTTVTLDRQPMFADIASGRHVVRVLREAQQTGLAETLAFVVMPDHVHWLFTLTGGELSALLNRVKSRSAIMINRARGSSGPVWQRGFHDHAVRRDEDVQALARYVVANPVRAGIVARVGDYPLWDAVWV